MKAIAKALCAFALLLFSTASLADVMDNEAAARSGFEAREFTCPVGGERFSQPTTYPHFPLEPFPDGSHLGDQWVEMQIPLCPGNGLVILPDGSGELEEDGPTYRDYTKAQLARLPELIASADYRALDGATRQLKAYWIATQLGLPEWERLQFLTQAPWGATGEKRELALEWLVRDGPALIASHAIDKKLKAAALTDYERDGPEFVGAERLDLKLLVVNALRELGRFDEAKAMLDAMGDEPPGDASADDYDPYAEWTSTQRVRFAIETRNTERYPLVTLSNRWARDICNNPFNPLLHATERTVKECEPRRAATMKLRQETPMADLLLDDALDGGACGSLDETGDSACEAAPVSEAQSDPVGLAARCRAYELKPDDPASEPDMSLYEECWSYREMREAAVADILTREDPLYGSLCLPPSVFVALPMCQTARQARLDNEAAALLDDREALAAQCKAIAGYDRPIALYRACFALERGDKIPYWIAYGDTTRLSDPLYLAAAPHAREDIENTLAKQPVP